MKKIAFMFLIGLSLTSCRSCYADYEQRKKGVQKVCPNCIYTVSESMHIAQDTSTEPNTIYRVTFCTGGAYYNAWDVDHLTKIQ